jgi:hypothetical protein
MKQGSWRHILVLGSCIVALTTAFGCGSGSSSTPSSSRAALTNKVDDDHDGKTDEAGEGKDDDKDHKVDEAGEDKDACESADDDTADEADEGDEADEADEADEVDEADEADEADDADEADEAGDDNDADDDEGTQCRAEKK